MSRWVSVGEGQTKTKKNVHIYIIICVCVFVCVLSASVTPTPRCRVGGLSGAALLVGIAADGAEKPTSCSTRIAAAATATVQWTPRACVVFECDRCPRWDRESSYVFETTYTTLLLLSFVSEDFRPSYNIINIIIGRCIYRKYNIILYTFTPHYYLHAYYNIFVSCRAFYLFDLFGLFFEVFFFFFGGEIS